MGGGGEDSRISRKNCGTCSSSQEVTKTCNQLLVVRRGGGGAQYWGLGVTNESVDVCQRVATVLCTWYSLIVSLYKSAIPCEQGVTIFTKRCGLSWLTNSALVIRVQMRGRDGVAGSQPMSTAVHIMWHGAQKNFWDLPPYLTYAWELQIRRNPYFLGRSLKDRVEKNRANSAVEFVLYLRRWDTAKECTP